jgi:hypothetical protein
MTDMLRSWYLFVKTQPCCRCSEQPPVEAAHVRVMRSSKTGGLLGRSHKGRAAWACIPLCKACHEEQHQRGEFRFAQDNYLDYGQIVATNLVRFFVERHEEEEDE